MPEGDTVRRTADRLHEALGGAELARAELRWGDLGGADLAGRCVHNVTAYGKHLLIRLGSVTAEGSAVPSPPLTLHTHLRMDGEWFLHRTGSRPWPAADDDSVRAVLAVPDWTAVGHHLGMLDLLPTTDEPRLLGHLGPDVMAPDFLDTGMSMALARLVASPGRHIGAALLDQTVVAGIGTIYMSESLFAQRVSPWQATGDVDPVKILTTARRLLLRSLALPLPNTTGDPRPGARTYVHGRSGRPCRRCGTTIRVAPVGAPPYERPAFYCPVCQPGPAPTDDGRPARPLGSAPARPFSLRNNGLRQRR